MLTPAMSASRTSVPAVINWNALATHVNPSASFDLFPFRDATTSGFGPRWLGNVGDWASVATAGLNNVPTPDTATNVLRLILCLDFIVLHRRQRVNRGQSGFPLMAPH